MDTQTPQQFTSIAQSVQRLMYSFNWFTSRNHGHFNSDLLGEIITIKSKLADVDIQHQVKVSLAIKGTWIEGVYTPYINR